MRGKLVGATATAFRLGYKRLKNLAPRWRTNFDAAWVSLPLPHGDMTPALFAIRAMRGGLLGRRPVKW